MSLRTCTHCGEEAVLNGIGECVSCQASKIFGAGFALPPVPKSGAFTPPEREKRLKLLQVAGGLAEKLGDVLVKINENDKKKRWQMLVAQGQFDTFYGFFAAYILRETPP